MSAIFQPRFPGATRFRIIYALMMRESVGKHGHETLGFFWIIGEPMLLMSGIMFLWSMAHITHGSEIDVIPFALSAYSYLTLWRHIAGASVKIIHRSRLLLYHRQIMTLDVLIAKSILETIALMATFFVTYFPLYLMHLCPPLYDPLLLVGGFVFTGWFAFAFGLFLAAASEMSEATHHVIGPIMYITLPVTGAFTMQDWLPLSAQKALSWSPLVNCIEMLRAGVFSPDAITTHFDFPYLLECCLVLTCIGLILVIYADRRTDA